MYMCCHLREVKKNGSENYVAQKGWKIYGMSLWITDYNSFVYSKYKYSYILCLLMTWIQNMKPSSLTKEIKI